MLSNFRRRRILQSQTLVAAQKGQNRPETYREIVRLCRDHGISSHFSNIIGFPQDTEEEVHEHVEVLRELGPTWSSFYILCPILALNSTTTF